ncbi:MAG: PEP-CTERM sorting domain-containing protein [Acidobacteriota bacterium]
MRYVPVKYSVPAWACHLLLLLAAHGPAQAALQGRDVDGVAANGYEAFYDTVLNVTWLADANYAKTSGFHVNGAMSWDQAMAWAESLSFQGVSGWRLPHLAAINGVSLVYYSPILADAYNGHIDSGFNITSPRNELSYMYYVNLGLQGALNPEGVFQPTAGLNPSGSQPVPGLPGATISNFQSNMYWTDVRDQDEFQKSWGFWTSSFVTGASGRDYRYHMHYAWAVHDGDAFKIATPDPIPTPTVAEPATGWMMLAGFGVCAHLTRRRRDVRRSPVALA